MSDDYTEEFVGQSYGRVNKAEAKILVAYLKK